MIEIPELIELIKTKIVKINLCPYYTPDEKNDIVMGYEEILDLIEDSEKTKDERIMTFLTLGL